MANDNYIRSPWEERAVCPGCGWHTRAPFGSSFHARVSICPKCGERNHWGSWPVKTMRKIDPAVLYDPRTWGKSYWDIKIGDKIEKYEPDRHKGQ